MFKRLMLVAATIAAVSAPAIQASAQDYGRRGGHDRYDDRGGDRDRGVRRGRGGDRDRHDRGDRYDRGNRDGGRWQRGNRDWWRGRSEWRGYNGRRNGYYYAPGYGYYRYDQRYHGRRWGRGAYLPQSYRRYYVQDPYFYNLREAPYGYRWVYVDNDLVLVSIATGLILDVLLDVY